MSKLKPTPKLEALTKEMSDNLFRADDKYSERSYKYSKAGKWKKDKFINKPSKYNDWEFKEHKYFSRKYFNTLKVGQKGYVIREYVGKTKYMIYKCEIVDKYFLSKIIVFKVEDMMRCNNNILDSYE